MEKTQKIINDVFVHCQDFFPLLLKDKTKQLNDLKHLWYKNTYCSAGFTDLIEITAILLQVIPSTVSATEKEQCKASVKLAMTCSSIQTCTLCSGLIRCEKQDCFIHFNRKT